MLDRVLDVIFGKTLEGEDAERVRARAQHLPKWACTVYFALLWTTFLGATALFAWHWGWIPFLESRIDSIWALAALGGNALIRMAWEQITSRAERRAKTGLTVQATLSE
ncbi:MAG: hypothetical protein U1E18_16530 [Brevundimonas sp.]|uniref:hypothetical protein n=1 Tax=Brevundimonas sp. TaxID=1871086 RepID=UPI002AB96ED4|nr:hypothetical protein [Brevundimonas sp.]MDZ4111192.1 hypothetical protein [Brevundimonas sp.]